MKALTVRQPWAWAIMAGGKDVENRTFRTKNTGRLAIHAGLLYDRHAHTFDVLTEAMHPRHEASRMLERGAILGTVHLTGCHHASECDDTCTPWAQPGDLWHWEITDPEPINPIPYKGRLGIWWLPDGIVT